MRLTLVRYALLGWESSDRAVTHLVAGPVRPEDVSDGLIRRSFTVPNAVDTDGVTAVDEDVLDWLIAELPFEIPVRDVEENSFFGRVGVKGETNALAKLVHVPGNGSDLPRILHTQIAC